ncbi:MAG: T9SS type A sorting domain-containing protein [Bacteroidetes bacterium]|nr:T9SS type A sorting domain-containing protein [Bacteroidota bacterium]
MKKLISTAAIAFLTFLLSAQSFKITPNDTIIATAPAGGVEVYDIWQLNTGSNTIILHWKPVGVSIPSGWDYSMCDLGTCYPGVPGGTMSPVSPGDSGFLGFNVIPGGLGGVAIVRCYVYADSFINDGDTLTWIITSDANSGLSASHITQFSFYPNPVSDLLHFNRPLRTIEVFDIQGRSILQSYNSESLLNSIDLSAAHYGVYLLKGFDEQNRMVTEKIYKN